MGLGRCTDVLDGSGVVLALELLNTLIDHPGHYLPSTTEGLDIVGLGYQPTGETAASLKAVLAA